jgi:hypothetical protein
MADFWPVAASPRLKPGGPQPTGDETEYPEPPEHGRLRLTRGTVLAMVLLLVIAGALGTLVKRARSQPSRAAAPAISPEASPASPASPVPTGAASVAPAPTPTARPASPRPPILPPAKAGTTSAPKLPAAATFEVAATAGSVTVRSQNLGADLYRVTLAKATGPVTAKVSDSGGNHRLTLVKDAKTVAPPVTIALNAAVRWSLKLSAGNTETTANLTRSRLAALELAGGAHVFTLALPRATGTLPVRVTHGMNQLKIDTNGVPVRLSLDDGAGKVVLDGETNTGNGRGKVITSDDWAAATNRIDLDSVEGVGTLTVDTQ